ncbi:MAG: TIGR00366 family protein, partial [Sphaerochaetaceae bacterium]|nr:TIGR00366 family protein [Sphaerochaetaceae bacterium]
SIAELPLYSGFWYRLIFFIIVIATTLIYTFKYAKKIKEDPSASLMNDVDYKDLGLNTEEKIELTLQRKLILCAFIISIIILLVGVMRYGWYINEMGALFFGLGIVSGIIYRMKLNTMGELFVEGAKSLLYGALLIGIARGIMVVLENGQILDSVVYYLVQPLAYLPRVISASLMVIIQTFINFFVPSGSGQAMVTMPIMIPVSDILEIPRQVAVLAFQYGDGLSNMFIPTLGATMAALGMARVSYGKWISYAWKLLVIHLVIGIIAVALATLLNLGPF